MGSSPQSVGVPATPAGGEQRPCPYCGVWNQADFVFCKRCGKQLPSLGEAIASPPSIPTTGGVPESMVAEDGEGEGNVHTRPLTSSETESMRRALRMPPLAPLQFLGAFVGIIPISLIVAATLGTSFVPLNYYVIMLVSGFLGTALAGTSRNMRTPIIRGILGGKAHEVWGVPQVDPAEGSKFATVRLGDKKFRMRRPQAGDLLAGCMNHLVYVEGGPVLGPGPRQGWLVALVLEWNGQVPRRPQACQVQDPSAAAGAAPRGRGLSRSSLGGWRR